MGSNLVMRTKRTRSHNAVAAGSSNSNGAVLDMTGFEGVVFTAMLGTLTATQVTGAKVQVGNASNLSDATDLVGATVGPMADGDSNKCLVLEVHKFPVGYRYCRLVITRATANAVIDGAMAEQYGSHKMPETEDSTVAFATVCVEPYISDSGLTATTTTPTNTTTKLVTTARTSS